MGFSWIRPAERADTPAQAHTEVCIYDRRGSHDTETESSNDLRHTKVTIFAHSFGRIQKLQTFGIQTQITYLVFYPTKHWATAFYHSTYSIVANVIPRVSNT